ncbi:MAG: hypothetical protein WA324_16360 [Bryobacteraceae bacterium]
MSFATFFPTDAVSLIFVLGLILWFVAWVVRLSRDSDRIREIPPSLDILDGSIEHLRNQQLWRDRQTLEGREAKADPSQFFDNVVLGAFRDRHAKPPVPTIHTHVKAIFVAGCEESFLDAAELTAATMQELGRPAERLRVETYLMVLTGLLGTLFALLRDSSLTTSFAFHQSMPPVVWGVLFSVIASFLFLRFKSTVQDPCFSNIRRKTVTLWIPRLYPTVAQRAARWATQTLKNAARVTDASEVIEKNTIDFVGAIGSARQASEAFAEGMRQFSHGIEASDQALVRAQAKLGSEVEKFADSLQRWTAFEDELRRFYASVEAQQKQMFEERKTLNSLNDAARLLPSAFSAAADRMTQSTTDFQLSISKLVAEVGAKLERGNHQNLAELQQRMEDVLAPVLKMEDRLRALGEPFERTAHEFTEIATNLWKLNENFSREVTRRLAEK